MPSLIPVDNTLGASFVGVVLSSMLYGVTCLQVYSYYSQNCKDDRPFLKYFVITLLTFESLQMAFLIHGHYILAVTNFGDLAADLVIPWSLEAQSFTGIFISSAIQQLYAWRIYKLSMGKTYIPSLIVVLSLAELAFGIVFFVNTSRRPSYQEVTTQVPIAVASLSLQVACDLTITITMVYYLLTRTTMKRTIAATTTLALYFITSGALTLVLSIANLIVFIRFSDTLIYTPFYFVLVRIYFCSFMAILNSRDRIRSKLAGDAENGVFITISRLTRSGRGTGINAESDVGELSTADPPSQKDFATKSRMSTDPV